MPDLRPIDDRPELGAVTGDRGHGPTDESRRSAHVVDRVQSVAGRNQYPRHRSMFSRMPAAYDAWMAEVVLPKAARHLLESDALAQVVTLDADGGPQVTAAWVGLEANEIVIATLPDQRKLENLRRDPRIALSVPATTRNDFGLLEYLVVYGTARVTEGGAPELLQRLAHTYLGPDVVFPNMPDPPRGFITRV